MYLFENYVRLCFTSMRKVLPLQKLTVSYIRISSHQLCLGRDYVRGGAEGALAPPEFEGSEKRTERETDNLLLIAPPESKS